MAKILLVEDDNNLREIYEARLSAEGYEIVSARDGEEALTVAIKERPDLIISDVMMPKISGFDMLDIIRSTEETKDAKVIMMTALSQAEDKTRADKLGADRYLVKSQVTLEDVAKVAREVLSGETEAPAASNDTPTATTTSTDDTSGTTDVADAVPAAGAAVAATSTNSASDTATDTTTQASTDTASAPSAPTQTTTTDDKPATDDAQDQPSNDAQQADPSSIAQSAVATSTATSDSNDTDEASAIAKQIESFMETKANVTPAPAGPQPTPEQQTHTDTDPVVQENTDNADPNAKISGKKVIEPIGDPLASAAPKLEELAKQEETKEQMAQVAKDLVAKKAAEEQAKVAAEIQTAEASSQSAAEVATPPVAAPAEDQAQAPPATEPEQAAVQTEPEGPSPEEQAAMQALKEAAQNKTTDTPEASGTTSLGAVEEQAAEALGQTNATQAAENGSDLVIGDDGSLIPETDTATPADIPQPVIADPVALAEPEPAQATAATSEPSLPVATPPSEPPQATTTEAATTQAAAVEQPIAEEQSPPVTKPVIPHENGVSMDGVVPPPATKPAEQTGPADPHSIAL